MWWKKTLAKWYFKRAPVKQKIILRGKQIIHLKNHFFDRFKGVVDSDEKENNKKGEDEKNDDEKIRKIIWKQ